MSLLTTALFLFLLTIVLLYFIKLYKERPINFPPGPPRLPIWGSYWYLLKEHKYPQVALLSLCKKYKTDILGFYLGKNTAITASSYDLCKELLTRDEFIGRNDSIVVRNRGLGELLGIIFVDGLYWKDQRRFSLRHMRDFGFGRRDQSMEDNTLGELKGLIELFTSKPKPEDSDVCLEEGIVKMPDALFGAALNSIHHTLSAHHFTDYSELRKIAKAAVNFLQSVDSTGCSISISPWLRFIAPEYFGWNTAFRETKILTAFINKVIEEHKKTYVRNYHRDFIDVYLTEINVLKENNEWEKSSFTERQLLYIIMDYMFPAPVGVGHQLQYLFAYLINQPDIQVNIQKEIDTIVGKSRLPTLDDRKDMPYTEANLREIIRKEPIVPLCIARRCTEDTTLGGYFIPKDTIVLPNLWAAHNDPRLWGDPENFRPERWLDDHGKLLKKDYTLGFGAGKRLCAGETFARNTMFLFLAGIMQNFSLKEPNNKFIITDLEHQVNGINICLPDYWMQVVPRL